MPKFTESLLSVDQLWADSRWTSVPRHLPIFVPRRQRPRLHCSSSGETSSTWDAVVATHEADPDLLKATVHRPKTASHLANVSATKLGMLHRRLHVSMETIKHLGKFKADVPESVSRARSLVDRSRPTRRVPRGGTLHAVARRSPNSRRHRWPVQVLEARHYRYFLVLVDDPPASSGIS